MYICVCMQVYAACACKCYRLINAGSSFSGTHRENPRMFKARFSISSLPETKRMILFLFSPGTLSRDNRESMTLVNSWSFWRKLTSDPWSTRTVWSLWQSQTRYWSIHCRIGIGMQRRSRKSLACPRPETAKHRLVEYTSTHRLPRGRCPDWAARNSRSPVPRTPVCRITLCAQNRAPVDAIDPSLRRKQRVIDELVDTVFLFFFSVTYQLDARHRRWRRQ